MGCAVRRTPSVASLAEAVPTLGRAGGEGAGLRCVAGDLGVPVALAALQAALPRSPVGRGGWKGVRWAAGPSRPGAIICARRRPRAPRVRTGAEPRGRGWNSSQAGAPSRRPSRAPASSRSPRAPLPAASQLRAPGAGKKPHAPARNAGPGGRGAGAGQGRAGQGRERPAGKVGERESASPHPPWLPAPPLRPAGAPHGPDRAISHFPRRTPGRDDPRAPGAGGAREGRGGAARPPPRAPCPRRLGEGGRPSRFPTPLPAAGGFGAPVGSRGLISRGAGVWPAGPRVVSHTRCSPSPGAERASSPS